MKRNPKLIFCIVLLAGLILPAGCVVPAPRTGENPVPVPTAAQSFEEPYPATPEEVALFFLEAYPSSPADGIKYLSPRLTVSLTEESALDLLPLRDIPFEFNLQQGSTSLETQSSVILVELIYETTLYWVEFRLVMVDGKWRIDQIDSV